MTITGFTVPKGTNNFRLEILSEAKGDIVRSLRLMLIVAELIAAGAITLAEDYMSFKKLTGICCGSPLGRFIGPYGGFVVRMGYPNECIKVHIIMLL